MRDFYFKNFSKSNFMRIFIKIIFILTIIGFIVIQFFQPKKNIETPSVNLIFNHETMPAGVQKTISNACLDCHSNNTKYLWYHKISPVSWMIHDHIVKGKKELNFSDWGKLDEYDKIIALEGIKKEVERKTMPIKPYILIHPEAKLTEEQRAEFLVWIEKRVEELVKATS